MPSEVFKVRMIASEHSPLREVVVVLDFENIRSWVSVHLVRHFLGVEKYVSTQRSDRREHELPRDEQPQGALVNMRMVLNAQALINVSGRRLCHAASIETVQAWQTVRRAVKLIDENLWSTMVPVCIYRGFCPEGSKAKKECKYSSKALKSMRENYLRKFSEENCII
jgi:hypothetical protein